MILVLTGPVNSGKTTFLKKLFLEPCLRSVPIHGFLSQRRQEQSATTGYDLIDLQSQKPYPYLRTKGEKNWEKTGPYYFVPGTLNKAKDIIMNHRFSAWLVVDEIGPLELKGKGIWPALSRVLSNKNLKLLCVVRKGILHDFLKAITPKKTRILDIHDENLSAETIKLLTELDQSPSD